MNWIFTDGRHSQSQCKWIVADTSWGGKRKLATNTHNCFHSIVASNMRREQVQVACGISCNRHPIIHLVHACISLIHLCLRIANSSLFLWCSDARSSIDKLSTATRMKCHCEWAVRVWAYGFNLKIHFVYLFPFFFFSFTTLGYFQYFHFWSYFPMNQLILLLWITSNWKLHNFNSAKTNKNKYILFFFFFFFCLMSPTSHISLATHSSLSVVRCFVVTHVLNTECRMDSS